MTGNSGDNKKRAHDLLDQLDSAQVSAVIPLLQFMLLDPMARALAGAAVEGQSISSDEAEGLDQAQASLKKGEGISHEDILREFGLPTR